MTIPIVSLQVVGAYIIPDIISLSTISSVFICICIDKHPLASKGSTKSLIHVTFQICVFNCISNLVIVGVAPDSGSVEDKNWWDPQLEPILITILDG